MIQIKTFTFAASIFSDVPETQLEMKDFLNQIGQENIIQITCACNPGSRYHYTVFYNDNSEN